MAPGEEDETAAGGTLSWGAEGRSPTLRWWVNLRHIHTRRSRGAWDLQSLLACLSCVRLHRTPSELMRASLKSEP